MPLTKLVSGLMRLLASKGKLRIKAGLSPSTRPLREAALEVASVEIDGIIVFLGDCEHRLVLVKMYEAPAELPDTALISRLWPGS